MCPVFLLDVSSMSGVIKRTYPFGQVSFSSLPANPAASPRPSLAISSFHREKGVMEIALEEICIKFEGFGTWISYLIFILSQGTLIPNLVQSTWLELGFEILLVEMLHYLSRSNAQSLELIREGLNLGTLVRVAGHAHRTCLICLPNVFGMTQQSRPSASLWFNPIW